MIYVFGPRLQGFFRFSKAGDAGFLVVNTTIDGDGNRSTDLWSDTSDGAVRRVVREALGAPEVRSRWRTCSGGTRARSGPGGFQDGRVFLVGDAAHNMPPTGGFGGNTGVQDGHNLAWKLALVLQGVAG